jgi:hypothetical protein
MLLWLLLLNQMMIQQIQNFPIYLKNQLLNFDHGIMAKFRPSAHAMLYEDKEKFRILYATNITLQITEIS